MDPMGMKTPQKSSKHPRVVVKAASGQTYGRNFHEIPKLFSLYEVLMLLNLPEEEREVTAWLNGNEGKVRIHG